MVACGPCGVQIYPIHSEISSCSGTCYTDSPSNLQEGYYSGALISTVENGIYTVFGAVLITVVFREKLSQRQLNLGVGAGGSEELKPEQLCLGSTCMVEKPQGPQVCMSDSRFDGTLVISVAIFNNPWALGDGQGR